jgi:hypothetical protein
MPLVSVTLVDAFGRTTNRRYELEPQLDLATYETVVADYVADLLAVTDLGLVKADLILPQLGLGSTPEVGANVDVGATFSGLLEGDEGKKASIKLPGIAMVNVNPDGSVPITGVVEEWLGNFETGGVFLLSDGESIESWLAGALDR